MTSAGVVATIIVSLVVTTVELNASLTKPLAYRRLGIAGWLVARLAFDVSAGVFVFAVVLPLMAKCSSWTGGIAGGIVAGLGAPVLLRVQLATFKAGKEHAALGFGKRYGQLRKKIDAVLADLTPRERMVFEMRHYQGMRLRAIGDVLGTSEEAAKNCLFRATQKMRSALGEFL